MHEDLKKAIEILESEDRALVLVKNGEVVMFDDRRGIGPMYDLATKEEGFATNGSLADKVIGKAAAMLASDAKIARLHAGVISIEAEKVLELAGIEFDFSERVPFIQNRDKTGKCPMERLAGDLGYEEVDVLKTRLKEFLGDRGKVHTA